MNNQDKKISITELQIMPIKPQDGLVGFASFIIDKSFYVGSIGIFTRPQGGYRLTYPTRKVGAANINIFHPTNLLVAQQIEDAVITKFEELMNK